MGRVDPMERALNALTLLRESQRPLSRAEIAAELATSSTPYPADDDAQRQQYATDRQVIAAALGVPVRQAHREGDDAGQVEYWIDDEDILLGDLELDDDERLMLALSLAAVGRHVPHAGEAGLKLGVEEADGASFELSVEVSDAVTALIEAARDGAVVSLVSGGSGNDEPFTFEPWALVLRGGAWVAIGYDPGRAERRMVRLGRPPIEVTVLDVVRSQAAPALGQSGMSELSSVLDDEMPVAQVLVDDVTVARASLWPRVIERSQVDLFDRVEMLVSADDPAELRSWVLGLGARAELLAPAELRRELIGWLEAVAAHSSSGVEAPPKPKTPTGRPRGPEPVDTRLHRLLSIVPWLHRRGGATVSEIAKRVGAPASRVMKDLEVASMAGRPPHTPDLLYGFWVERETGVVHCDAGGLSTGDLQLTGRQAAATSVALSAIEALPGGDEEVLARLRKKLDAVIGALPVRIELDKPPFLADLRSAAESCDRLRIEYVDPDDNVNERDIDPLKVFADRDSWYVLADDHLRGGKHRVFRVDRILSVMATGERFEPVDVASPAGPTWEWMVADREVAVRLPPGSEWVLDRYATVAHDLAADGWLTVWLSVVSERWLSTLLLSCGPGAEVLSPTELAGLPAAEAGRILTRYR